MAATFCREENAWEILEEFSQVDVLLFKHLVCGPLDVCYEDYDWLNVPATIFTLRASVDQLPIMINRVPYKLNGYWDHEIKLVDQADLSLAFISYFDWDPMGTVDHRYIMAKVVDAASSKQVIGHVAIVESMQVDVVHVKEN